MDIDRERYIYMYMYIEIEFRDAFREREIDRQIDRDRLTYIMEDRPADRQTNRYTEILDRDIDRYRKR